MKQKPYIEDIVGNGLNDEQDSIQAWYNYLLRDKSVIVDIFQGQLRNTLRCTKCLHCSIKFEPFMYLSIPIQNNTTTTTTDDDNTNTDDDDTTLSLDDCLNLFCREELLTKENQWYCSKCKEHVDATKKFDLWTLPPILIVHLKRFKHDQNYHDDDALVDAVTDVDVDADPDALVETSFGSYSDITSWITNSFTTTRNNNNNDNNNKKKQGARSNVTKLNQKINFPLRDWKPCIARKNVKFSNNNNNNCNDPSYDLYAVSNHFGGYGSGHYTAFAMNRIDDEWYEFNDSLTKKINEDYIEERNDAAYLLFYNQIDKSNVVMTGATTRNASGSGNGSGSTKNNATMNDSDIDLLVGGDESEGSITSSSRDCRSNRVPVVYMQSISRPEHWPHLQGGGDDENHQNAKEYTRRKQPPS